MLEVATQECEHRNLSNTSEFEINMLELPLSYGRCVPFLDNVFHTCLLVTDEK